MTQKLSRMLIMS